jgi:superfamily II DNA or RNA helicase
MLSAFLTTTSAKAGATTAATAATAATADPATAARVLTARGYAVRKDALTTEQTEQIRKDLTVAPKVLARFAKDSKPFPLFLESPSRFYLPRAWAQTTSWLGEPEATVLGPGLPLPSKIAFKGTPYPYQEEIIKTFMDQGGNGLICVPCGRGKTFMALNIGVRLGARFLIVVDKEFLMNQWKGEIERYIEGARIGIVQSDRQEIDPAKYDITICMIQTICLRDYAPNAFEGYGYTIFDECHHLGAQHFSGVLKKIQTKWMLGLSATPDRDDGLTKVFEYYLGKPVYQEKIREPDPTVVVRAIWYQSEEKSYKTVPVNYRGEVITARLLTQIVEHRPRTEMILGHLHELVADSRRKILVLSERRAHLEEICAGLPATVTKGYYVGGMKQADLDTNAETCQVLLATYAMASEAMNIKALNAMIMASPRKKVEQSTGRILRVSPDKRSVFPLILDVVDQHDLYVNQWYQRRRYYKKCAYTLEHIGTPRKAAAEVRAAAEKEAAVAAEAGCMIRLAGNE